MNRYYYLDSKRNVIGPVLLETLKEMASEGGLSQKDKICKEGEEEWVEFAIAMGRQDAHGIQRLGFKFACPKCSQRISAGIADEGIVTECPACEAVFEVPAPQNEEALAQSLDSVQKKPSRKRLGVLVCILVLTLGVGFILKLGRSEDVESDLYDSFSELMTSQSSRKDSNVLPEEKPHPGGQPIEAEKTNSIKPAEGLGETIVEEDNGQKDQVAKRNFSIAGIRLGMEKEEVVTVLSKVLGSDVVLAVAPKTKRSSSIFVATSRTSSLNQILSDSTFRFSPSGELFGVTLNMKVIEAISGTGNIPTEDFAQQVMSKYGIDQLEIKNLPTRSDVFSQKVYEAQIFNGKKRVRVLIQVISQPKWSDTRLFSLSLVDPLSFGRKRTLLGLELGMSKAQVSAGLRQVFGKGIRFVKSENPKNAKLSKSMNAYDLDIGRAIFGDSSRSFVVFNAEGKLDRVRLNRQLLEEAATGCQEYNLAVFSQEFMSHFDISKMKTILTRDVVRYDFKRGDVFYRFEYGPIARFSIDLFRPANTKAKF